MKKLAACLLLTLGASSAFAQAPFTLLEYTNEWRYLQGNFAPGNWFATDYDDAGWPAGRGIFAFPTNENVLGVAPVNTELTTNTGVQYIITHYFRTVLVLSSNLSNVVISGSAAIDDGAVIYVNGREARRIGMPAGTTITYDSLANRADDVSGRPLDAFTLASSNFVEGVNVIAVEVHQASPNSADVVFGLKLSAQVLEPVSIVAHPADQTVEVGRRATFSVQASGSALSYQWFVNNTRINLATNSSYLAPPATLAMNGWRYHVVVSNAVGSVTSQATTLTVVPDETGPLVQYAVVTAPTHVEIQFSEWLLWSAATNRANYSLLVLGTTNRVAITNVLFAVDRVRLVANQMLDPSSNYVVCLGNVADFYTNVITPNPICVGVGFPLTNTAVNLGGLWRFNDNETSALPGTWTTLEYDDDPFRPPYHWAEGYGGFGYSFSPNFVPCAPLRTPLSGGINTYYFRKRFVLTNSYPAETVLRLRRLVDDGAVFYLNGAEIFRTNMPPGIVEYSTLATHVSNAVCIATGLLLPPDSLIQGTNILAVEVHQARETQAQLTDVVFDAELALEFRRTPIIPELRVAYNAGDAVLTWEGTGWSLETADDVSGPWSRLSAPGNRHASPLNGPGEGKFFRLVNP